MSGREGVLQSPSYLVSPFLPVARPKMKPEGKGASITQPKKMVWEVGRMIWKNEWRMFSTFLLSKGDPELLTNPGKSVERDFG